MLNGPSNTLNLNGLSWTVDASATANVGLTLQLFNYISHQYPASGNLGYQNAQLTSGNMTQQQTITTSATNFRDNLGRWQLCITATISATSPFTLNVDFVRYRTSTSIYGLNVEEQWTNINTTALVHPALCIYAGSLGSSNLVVDAWSGGSWHTVLSGLVSGWNNMSINSYLPAGSTTFTVRFRNNGGGDISQINWQVAATLMRSESNQDLFTSLQNPAATVAVEMLQNGTMIWFGQSLKITTQSIPIPPVPVKAIHVNETINGVNRQVPFQIEDWASSYTVPLGLTNNATVFGNMQMIVFLVNTHVTAFTVWWNGSDQAIQTPLAYVDTQFTSDSSSGSLLNNGQLKLQFSGGFTVTSTMVDSGTSSTATYMRINGLGSSYGSGIDWVVVKGVVRDVVQQEAEWGGGVPGCPNFYADIVLTLPANATYYTYQLSLMFMTSQQARTITDLCPIELSSSAGQTQFQTENGTVQGDPVVVSGSNLFFNSTGTWMHHFSQLTNGTSGAGIMFTDQANKMLYAFDKISTPATRGALAANANQTISLLPVANSVSFQSALDVTWSGAVVTFDASVPTIYNGAGETGMWVLAEMPPTITVTVGN